MKSPEIRMYNALKPSLGEEDAQVFIEAHNEAVAAKIEIMKSDLATKGELREGINRLSDRITALEIKLTGQIAASESKLTGQMLNLDSKLTIQMANFDSKLQVMRAEIRDEMAKHRVDSARTSYIVGFVQLIGIIGAVLAIIKASS